LLGELILANINFYDDKSVKKNKFIKNPINIINISDLYSSVYFIGDGIIGIGRRN